MAESTNQSDRAVAPDSSNINISNSPEAVGAEAQENYVKLAMRNMVRKGRQSLWHFFLTTVGLVTVLVGLAYLTKP